MFGSFRFTPANYKSTRACEQKSHGFMSSLFTGQSLGNLSHTVDTLNVSCHCVPQEVPLISHESLQFPTLVSVMKHRHQIQWKSDRRLSQYLMKHEELLAMPTQLSSYTQLCILALFLFVGRVCSHFGQFSWKRICIFKTNMPLLCATWAQTAWFHLPKQIKGKRPRVQMTCPNLAL